MKKSRDDRFDQERREFVKGGLLTAAAALGFLPSCSEDGPGAAAEGGAAGPGAAGPGAAGATTTGEVATGSAAGSGSGGSTSSAGGRPSASPNAAGTRASAAGSSSGGRAASSEGGRSATAGNPAAVGGGNSGGPAGTGANAAGQMASGDPKSMVLPRGMLGKTGVSIPILGLGTSRLGERNNGNPRGADYDSMLEIFAAAIDMGVEYIDTGAVYGRAEEALGEVLVGRRDKVFLVTKLHTDTRSQAQSMFERSLERMKTDHVDLLHLHNTGDRNLDTALGQNGAWPYILEQKAAGRTRFVGFTGHSNGPNLTRMLATNEVDAMMVVMNFVDHSTYGFSKEVREDAIARGVGVMCMKVFGGTESPPGVGRGLGFAMDATPHPSNMQVSFDESVLPDCMRFVKTLPGLTGMVIGVNHLWELQRNIQWAIETTPFTQTEFDAIVKMGETVASRWARRYG